MSSEDLFYNVEEEEVAVDLKKRFRGFAYTLNNYTEEEYERIKSIGKVSYHIMAREIAPTTGTPHIQGYIHFKDVKKWKDAKKIVSKRCFIVMIKGSPFQNFKYCSKEDPNFIEIGIRPVGSGKRSDIDNLRTILKTIGLTTPVDELIVDYGNNQQQCSYIKTYVNSLINIKHEEDFKNRDIGKFTQCQQDWHDLLMIQDNRKILFIVDSIGNTGKSYFCNIMKKLYGHKVFITKGGKTLDLSYIFKREEYVLYDCPRTGEINYQFLECMKDGYITSNKYESQNKQWGGSKVIVLTNSEPDLSKLSLDRYLIINL